MIQREQLGRRTLFRLDTTGGYLAFLGRSQQLAGAAVENVQVALLGGQQQRRDLAGGGRVVDQGRLRAQVVIPDILAHRLEVPGRLARIDVDGDQ
ncbi:hypothetical protein D3C71_1122610 [compost metagenome]